MRMGWVGALCGLGLACGDAGGGSADDVESDGDPSATPGTTASSTSADEGTTTTTTDGGWTTPPDLGGDQCDVGEDLLAAPSPAAGDGLLAVPIDVVDVEARIVFESSDESATATATMTFETGGTSGNPVFDLRQIVDAAVLDGETLDPDELRHHFIGGEDDADMRVVERELEPCTTHVLELEYALGPPTSEDAPGPEWEDGALDFDFGFTDLRPGRYLEQWLPANLIYDRFPVTLELELRGVAEPHVLATNAETDVLGEMHWRLSFPSASTSLSQMVVVLPETDLESWVTPVALPGGDTFDLEVHRHVDATDPLDFDAVLTDALVEFTASTGTYPFGDRFVMVVRNRGMEYDGAAMVSPSETTVRHELFHMWYGRGAKPASQADGWIDEAWTVYNTHPDEAFSGDAIPADETPLMLASDDPWSRRTSGAAYGRGALVFSNVAYVAGLDPLRDSMRAFFDDHVGQRMTTAGLQRHLYCDLDQDAILALFHTHVFALPDDHEPPPADYCD